MARINVGDPAPDFALPDAAGTTHRLRDALARGSVVLVFYVLDNTPG
jgi:peroxiredoxin Q/BCP